MKKRKYYDAYDDRYRQVHEQNLQWFDENPSPIVGEIIREFSVSSEHQLLEIGCGEGRDALPLLEHRFDLMATDVSAEAISYCQKMMPAYKTNFQILDCVTETLDKTFDFIYAIAVIHMLVTDEDRKGFYSFIQKHLKPTGIALICTMGDGTVERQTDIHNAFAVQNRIHDKTGKILQIANTSCRMVSFKTFIEELTENGLDVMKQGITSVEPDFPQMMFAVVRSRK